MFGFTLIKTAKEFHFDIKAKDSLSCHDVIVYNHMIDKFQDDKLFFKNDDFLVVLDGVVFNKRAIIKQEGARSWEECVVALYRKHGDIFYDVFRGSFSGVLYDIKYDKLLVFSDHIGSKYLYYYKDHENFFITSYISNAYQFFKQNKINYHLSVENAYLLLTHGNMIEDRTLCDELKKLLPGCYLSIGKGVVEERSYSKFGNEAVENIKIDEAIEILDDKFRKAIQLQFDKDDEYGYKHICALSGGLDSRMTSLIAHEMGYTRQTNYTFSQTDWWDQTLPMKMASDYKHEWLFKSLDDGWWLADFDDVVNNNGGNVLYYGTAHGKSLLYMLDLEDFGLLHSGQLGDVFIRRTYRKYPNQGYAIEHGASSKFLYPKIKGIELRVNYPNSEIGILYNRGFTGINNSMTMVYERSESYAPQEDVDFIKFALQLPDYGGYKLIQKWICDKYPSIAKYGWDALNGHSLTDIGPKIIDAINFKIQVGKKQIVLKEIPTKIRRRLYGKATEMNPIDDYLKSNSNLYRYLLDYYYSNKYLIKDEALLADMDTMVINRNGVELVKVLTLVSAIKQFFS